MPKVTEKKALNQCGFCGNTGTILVDGYCINRTRCEKRRKELIRAQKELLIRAHDLLVRLEISDAAMVVANVLEDIYGVENA